MKLDKLIIVRRDNKRAWAFCPFHKDKHTPNLCITLTGDYYGHYYCFACGKCGRIPGRILHRIHSGAESRKEDMEKLLLIDWHRLTMDYFTQSSARLYVLSDILNIQRDILDDFLIGWDGEAFTAPMYNENLDIIGIHRRFSNGRKCCVEGSKLGLFIAENGGRNHSKTLFICEGLSDTICVYDLGFFVIGKPCASVGNDLILEFVKRNSIKSIIVIPDNDDAGIKSSKELVKLLNNKNCRISTYWINNQYKDIRDYIASKGKSFVQQELQQCLK